MSEEERKEIIGKINNALEETDDTDLMEIYWYLKVYMN